MYVHIRETGKNEGPVKLHDTSFVNAGDAPADFRNTSVVDQNIVLGESPVPEYMTVFNQKICFHSQII